MEFFDSFAYPEIVVGCAMPEFEDGTVAVEVADSNDNMELYNIPSVAVQRMGMPRLAPEVRPTARERLEEGIGLALIACRVLDRHENLIAIELPTEPPTTLVVPWDRFARRR